MSETASTWLQSYRARRDAAWRAEVAPAANWLDIAVPGWASRIDVGLLDMRSIDHCVLGQCFKPVSVWWKPWTWMECRSGYGIGTDRVKREGKHFAVGIFACDQYQDYWIESIADRVVRRREYARSVGAVDPHVGIQESRPRAKTHSDSPIGVPVERS